MIVISIPAFNEGKTIAKVVTEIKDVMGTTKYKYQVLVVDDGSTDDTKKKAEAAGAIVYSHPRNMGLAEVFKTEMQKCLELNPKIIVHTDADGQYYAKDIPRLIDEIGNGYDLVLGSRFDKGSYSGSWVRKIGNIAFAKLFTSLLKVRITDTTTGLRAFTPEVALLPLINNFTYTQEQLIRAGKSKMRIKEVPVQTRRTRPSKLFGNPIDYAVKAWINILRIYRDFEPLKFFGMFGFMFVFSGFLIGLYIVYTILTTGTAGGIPRVILSMLLIIVGIQIGLFGFFADMLRK